MKEQTKTKARGLVAAVVVLAVVAGFLTIAYIGSATQMASYSTQLENNYQRSVYELMTDVNNIETNLSKALVSTGTKSRQDLFENINKQCTSANEDLSRLPINHESVYKTTSFINQMGGFSYYLANKIKNNEEITESDYNSLDELHSLCLYVQKILNDFSINYGGRYSVLANTRNYNDTSNSFNTMFSNMQAEGIEYPTLIYDGPFSESQVKKEVKGLSDTEITKDDAQQKIESLYSESDIKNLKYVGETSGIFNTYNFVFDLNDRQMFVQVTKKGGLILSISSYANNDEDNLSLTECEQKAEEFIGKIGLDLKAIWSTKITGIAYVNLTPIKNDVIIYPDMIKIKVSCNTGEVLGLDSQSYAYNHIERTIMEPTISENMARSKVDKKLTIEMQKLTLIPIEYGEETLCYEYKCTLNEDTYYVYINAKTGEETQILKVIETTNGNLLM